MGLTVTILGSSGGYPGPADACAGYLVRSPSTTVWLDAGSGTLANLQRHVALADIDAVVLSHEHPDHWRDIELLYVAYAYGDDARSDIPVFAPKGVEKLAYFRTGSVFSWSTVADGDDITIGDMRVRFSRTDHGPETLGVRIDADGRSMAYSADTGPAWSLARLGDGIDLALCENTLTREKEGTVQHLSSRQAGEKATEAGVAHLVLTHFWATNDRAVSMADAATTFRGRISAAAIGEEYDV
jgi:ribonuclease BN (tRNA processing enzyme)